MNVAFGARSCGNFRALEFGQLHRGPHFDLVQKPLQQMMNLFTIMDGLVAQLQEDGNFTNSLKLVRKHKLLLQKIVQPVDKPKQHF